MKLDRRSLLVGGAASGLAACVPLDISPPGRLTAKLRIIEAAAGGTLGVSIRNTATGQTLDYKADQKFGLCSTFKLSLAALVLYQEQSGGVDTGKILRWSQGDLLSYSPFTTERLAQGATARELAQAAQSFSDNTAANVLLREYGGPEALTNFWRALGDTTSRLDRIEPSLNNVPVGEVRDTTTPAAMALTVQRILFGDALSQDNLALLGQWMVETTTGLSRVRAGLPENWVVGDKTGTSLWPGMGSVYADIGFAATPAGAPMTFAAYYRAGRTHSKVEAGAENVLRQVGQVLAEFAAS